MDLSLDPKLRHYVEEKVRSGQYGSPTEVLNAAVSFMKDQEEWTPEDIEALRQDVAHAAAHLDRGEGAPWDADEIKERIKATVLRHQKAS
jgi:antitoxin ParD1/3/4